MTSLSAALPLHRAVAGILLLVAVSLVGFGCFDSPTPAGQASASSDMLDLFVDTQTPVTSLIDGREYTVIVEDRYVTFELDGKRVDRVPADVYAKAGSMYYERIKPEGSPETSLKYDTEAGTFEASASFGGRFVDIVLFAVSFIFALAFITTGVFLLRLTRQRRILSESRIRQMRAREAERTHLAAELHDGPVQELQHVLRSYMGSGSNEASFGMSSIRDMQTRLESVTAALRNICTELRPPVLAHFGLAYAVRSYADKFEQRLPETTIHVEISEDASLDNDEMSLALFRIFQESLSNIEKHAHASNVWVKLQIDEQWVELVVRDDGQGFQVPRRLDELEQGGHLGLSGLSQRAEAVGGVLEVRSTPGSGATIRTVARRPQDDSEPESSEVLEMA